MFRTIQCFVWQILFSNIRISVRFVNRELALCFIAVGHTVNLFHRKKQVINNDRAQKESNKKFYVNKKFDTFLLNLHNLITKHRPKKNLSKKDMNLRYRP